MRGSRTLIVLSAFAWWAALAAQQPTRLVFVNAKLADLASGRVRPVAALVVEGSKIAAVHAQMPATPPEGRTIDAGGATFLPGLADLAVQTHPSMDLDVDFFYAASLAHGVMRVRSVDVRLPWAVEQARRVAQDALPAPWLSTSGPALDMRTPLGARNQPILAGGALPIVQVADAAAAGKEAARQAQAGVEWVRAKENVPVEALRAVVASLRGTTAKVSVSPVAASMVQAASAGVGLIDGLGSPTKSYADLEAAFKTRPDPPASVAAGLEAAWAQLTPQELRAVVASLVRTRTPVAPMLTAQDAARGELPEVDRDLAYIPERLRVAIQARTAAAAQAGSDRRTRARAQQLAFVKELAKAGGRLVTASGATADGWPLPGAAVHRELRLLVEAGLTPVDALRAATVNAAAVIGERDASSWRPGAPADFFAVKGDPLNDLAALDEITLLVRAGQVLDRAQLLKQIRPRAR